MTAHMENVLHHVDQMPALAEVAVKIMQLVLEEEFSFQELTVLVESDPSLTLKVLKAANKADRGGVKVSSVSHAFPLLGIRPLRLLLLSIIVKDGLAGNADENDLHKELWLHSLACAIFSGLLAEKICPQLRNEAFAAGLLHDIGKMFCLIYFPDRYMDWREQVHENKEPNSLFEERILGTNYATIGRELARKWDLPSLIENTIWQCSLDSEISDDTERGEDAETANDGELREMLLLVKVAEHLAYDALGDLKALSRIHPVDINELLSPLGITRKELDAIKEAFPEEFEEHVSLFDLDSNGSALFYRALQQANERLANIALELDEKNSRLAISNRFSTNMVKAGIAFNKMEKISEFLASLPQYLSPELGITRGILYWVNDSQTFLEGVLWKEGRAHRIFAYPLNKNMEPVQEAGSPRISKGLSALIKTARERGLRPGEQPKRFSVGHGFSIFSLSGKGFAGELCLGREHPEQRMTTQEFLGFSPFVTLITTTLDRLRMYKELCERAEELSAALWKNQQVNLQLMQTERLASVGQLAAGVVHEINNPLAIISARTEMLETKEEDDKKKQELARVHEQIERITSILDRLMNFGRPFSPCKEMVEVTTLLDKVLDLVDPAMRKNDIGIERHYAKELPSLYADAGQLQQVILNLCINAQHAMEGKGGTLCVKAAPGISPKWLDITVSDTGVGIPSEYLEKVFDPFFTTKEQDKGTGLGLSVAYGIITNHYGKIDIKSEPGQGTSVCVSLPVMAPDEPDEDAE